MNLDPVLKTKLFIPQLREGLIARPRLINLINANINKKVCFISAPAGYGKSTLLSEWARTTELPVCWVSLDPSENDPAKFFSYLIAGVQTIWEDLGDTILNALNSPGAPPVDLLWNAWINELSEYSDDFVLILDDFHNISNPEVHEQLSNLISHQPTQLHLMIASRANLPISLSRMRASGDIGVIDISEMRFTINEAVDYLRSQMGDRITSQDALTISRRTEGWIVGLHMAVLSMRSCGNISEYVAQFSAADRYITDYLMDEILRCVPDEIERFLLATSILSKFTAPLCDYVTGEENSQEIIQSLVARGIFTIPLDTTRTWYRYHHLFSELLRVRLMNSPSFSIHTLHRKASGWFAAKGMLEESIEHAFASRDFRLVIKRIEDSLDEIMALGKFQDYLNWVGRVPAEYLEEKPRIAIVRLFMLYEMGQFDGLSDKIAKVEALLGPFPSDLRTRSRDELINFGILASIRTIISASRDFNVDETFRYASLADAMLPDSFQYWRALAKGAIPFLYRALGDYEKCIESYTGLLKEMLQANFLFMAFIAYSVLTKAYLETGRLKLALITCEEAISLDRKFNAKLPFAKYAYLLMGQLLYESGQLDSAETYIEKGLEQVVRHGDAFSIIEGYSTLAMIQIAKGDPDQAIAISEELRQVIDEIPSNQNSLAILNAWNARLQLMLGDCDQADAFLRQACIDTVDDQYMFEVGKFSYLGIYRVSQTPIRIYLDYLELIKARILLCQGRYALGIEVINQVLDRIAAGGNRRYEIEALIVKSLLQTKENKKPEAMETFQNAVALACREDYIQAFLNEGVEILPLIDSMKAFHSTDIEQRLFLLKLRENIQGAFEKQQQKAIDHLVHLTDREIEVLACLASGISYSQAAEQLSISRNTLKTHTKRIYHKLGVNGLLQALNRARQLELL